MATDVALRKIMVFSNRKYPTDLHDAAEMGEPICPMRPARELQGGANRGQRLR